jgi:carboxypeptidase family protein
MNSLTLPVCVLFCAQLLVQQNEYLLAVPGTNSVEQAESHPRPREGQLAGSVMADAGQALAHIDVTITLLGDPGPQGRRTTVTDERGGFLFSDIQDGVYSISVRAPGYVRASAVDQSTYYRPGDFAAVTMLKGGVITGTVRNHSGEALINVPVRAFRIADMRGKPTPPGGSFASRLTDDRGIYRLYGLLPGAYLVCAGGGSRSSSGFNKYQDEAPTYYPSSARQTAEKVTVDGGQEASGVNITYRGERGRVVSGVTTGAHTTRSGPSVTVALSDWSTREVISVGDTNQEDSFAFYGVPDGDYYLIAQYLAADENESSVSRPYRIKVTGADVTDVRLTLSPYGSVSGQVVLEPLPKEPAAQCREREKIVIEEAVISLQREPAKNDPEPLWDASSISSAPNEKGRFDIHRVSAGQYRINVTPSGESWSVKYITKSGGPTGEARVATRSDPRDSLLDSISIKLGEQIRLTVTLAEGAAKLGGRLSLPQGNTLRPHTSVHLVPTESTYSDNPLRFFHSDVKDDGTFSFAQLAAGKYWVFARVDPDTQNEKSIPDPSPWSATRRAALRKEAQKSDATIELRPCQSVQGYVVKY